MSVNSISDDADLVSLILALSGANAYLVTLTRQSVIPCASNSNLPLLSVNVAKMRSPDSSGNISTNALSIGSPPGLRILPERLRAWMRSGISIVTPKSGYWKSGGTVETLRLRVQPSEKAVREINAQHKSI